MPQTSDSIAIVTVHGTGDTATGPDGEKWFQRGSKFTERLKQRLARDGVTAEIVPHLWSGANSASNREHGANKLAARIRSMRNRYKSIHVIGHSHGGNVANDAAVLLKWGLRRKPGHERFDSLTTVGTPFFDSRTGLVQMIAGLLFYVLTWASLLIFPVGAFMSIGNWIEHPTNENLILTLLYLAAIGPCVWFMFLLSREGVRRILRPRGGKRTKRKVHAIWHENDEAISFLKRVEELPIEAFPRGSMFRSARGMAVSIGVLAVIALGLIIPALYVFHIDVFGLESTLTADAIANERASNTIAVAAIGLFLAPAIFVAIYWLWRILIGGTSELTARGAMNKFVRGTLQGIAMGRDGDQVICNVSTTSHTHETETFVLSGDVAHRMQAGAHDAAGRLIDKYRWALFSVGGDSSASLTTLTTDAMTWDSLIHTTYFDQPEVADVIGDYIAAVAQGREYVPAPPPSPPAAPPPEPPQPEAPPPTEEPRAA